jgi:hypothetical protein
MTSQNLILIGPRVVGGIFVITALMKAAAPASFWSHLIQLRLMPKAVSRIATALAIGVEAAWGVALLVGLSSPWFIWATLAGIAVLTTISLWSVTSGRTEDCGCYGGWISPSIWQTVGLNAGYCLLIAVALLRPGSAGVIASWQYVVVFIAFLLVVATVEFAIRFQLSTGVPLFTPSPLKAGRRWKRRWAGHTRIAGDAEHLFAYLGPTCPYCKRWVRVLNVLHESPNFPNVTAVFENNPQKVETFVREHQLRLPIALISPRNFRRLAPQVPTTVLTRDQQISEIWRGEMSEAFVRRFTNAFFPGASSGARAGPIPSRSEQRT